MAIPYGVSLQKEAGSRSASGSPFDLFVIVVLVSYAVKATEQFKQNEKYEKCFKHSGNESRVGGLSWRRSTRDLSSTNA
jgi:hypothetical protein